MARRRKKKKSTKAPSQLDRTSAYEETGGFEQANPLEETDEQPTGEQPSAPPHDHQLDETRAYGEVRRSDPQLDETGLYAATGSYAGVSPFEETGESAGTGSFAGVSPFEETGESQGTPAGADREPGGRDTRMLSRDDPPWAEKAWSEPRGPGETADFTLGDNPLASHAHGTWPQLADSSALGDTTEAGGKPDFASGEVFDLDADLGLPASRPALDQTERGDPFEGSGTQELAGDILEDLGEGLPDGTDELSPGDRPGDTAGVDSGDLPGDPDATDAQTASIALDGALGVEGGTDLEATNAMTASYEVRSGSFPGDSRGDTRDEPSEPDPSRSDAATADLDPGEPAAGEASRSGRVFGDSAADPLWDVFADDQRAAPASSTAPRPAPTQVASRVASALLSATVRALPVLALILLVVVLGERSIRTPDAYFHLHVGQEILDAKAPPRETTYTAFHVGRPFVDVEWGFQALVGWTARRAGLSGLLRLRAVLFLLATLLVFELCRRFGARGGLAALGASAFVFVAADRSLLAPESLSIVLLGLTLLILERRHAHRVVPFLLIPLTALWVNVHGFFVLAPALVLLYGIVDLAGRRSLRTLLLFVPVGLAGLANPYGVDGALYPFRVVLDTDKQALLRDLIVELRSPLLDPVLASTAQARKVQALAVFAVLGVALVLWRRKGSRLRTVLLLAFALPLGLSVLRNAGLFAVLAVPLALAGFGPWLRKLAARHRAVPVIGQLALAMLLIGSTVSLATGRGDASSIDGVGRGPRFAPAIAQDEAIDFYLDHGLPERVWCNFSSGHALIALSAGRLKPAICPHTDLASTELLRAYAEAVGGTRSLDALLDAYPADAFFVDHRRLLGSPLLDTLLLGERFTLVYLDGRSAIFLASAGRTARLAAHLAVDLSAVAQNPAGHLRLADEERPSQLDSGVSGWIQHVTGLTPPRVPRDRVSAALVLLAAERPQAAYDMAKIAYDAMPGWAPASYAVGVSARSLGKLDEAKDHLRRVARAAPTSAEPRHMLGLLHLELGEQERAIEELEDAVRLEPGNARYRQNLRLAYRMAGREAAAAAITIRGDDTDARTARALERFHEAASLAGAKRDAEAEQLYRSALALDPTLQVAYYNLGNLLFRRKRYSEAMLSYRRAVDLRPGDLEARYFLALTLDRLGRLDAARGELDAILRMRPDHKAARVLRARLGAGAGGSGGSNGSGGTP